MNPANLCVDPLLHLRNFVDAVRDLESLQLGNNSRSFDVFIKVDKLPRGAINRYWSLGRITNIDKGELRILSVWRMIVRSSKKTYISQESSQERQTWRDVVSQSCTKNSMVPRHIDY